MGRLDGIPIEALRPGGLPADDAHEPPFDPEMWNETVREHAWDEKSWKGRWPDGSPRLRNFGGGLTSWPGWMARDRAPRRCKVCQLEFRPENLASHDCPGPPEPTGEVAVTSECVVCRSVVNAGATICGRPKCRSAYQSRQDNHEDERPGDGTG